jgi:hypothetical protein
VSASVALPDRTAELFVDQPLVGRREHLKSLVALLEHPPSTAVVRGADGSGKSTLLGAFNRAAVARGGRSLRPPPLRPETDRNDLIRTLRTLAGLSETNPLGAVEARGDQLLGSTSQEFGHRAPTLEAEASLLDGLSSRRTVLLLDGFHANRDVQHWLLDQLLVQLRAAAKPMVTVIAGRGAHVRKAASHADLVLDAAPPTEAELRSYLGRSERSWTLRPAGTRSTSLPLKRRPRPG